ncbi:hypothetical protein JHD47_05970 [Sulfurimonas sp. SAG-AH-194-L11]|nr:hypothetical protein [Sulfurimonas sp. SAG-AH-194-L11]MDF1877359.1 hypothetical protein [Sulfurimonas sp. SAG-AH-194-L11]
MIKKIIASTLLLSLSVSVALAHPASRFNVINGDQEEKYEKEFLPLMEDETGFTLSDPHEKINDAYKERYGNPKDPDYDKAWTTNLDNLGFFSISNDKALYPILKTSPQAAGFQPFNLLIYKKIAEDVTYIGHLDPDTMLDITGVTNKADREAYVKMYEPLDALVTREFGGKIVTTEYTALPAKPMMTFEFEVDRSGDVVEWAETFQEEFEAAFEEKKYIIAGFKNFKETYEDDLEMEFSEYDQFFVYGLCHFTFSYNVFNKGRPDAGVFAPCAMYFYIKEGSNTMVVGMPRLSVWASVMELKDPAKVKWTETIDSEIIEIMKSLGAKEI